MRKAITCCFIGQSKFLPKKIEPILERLNYEIESLISQGVTDFISGGMLGFDQIAASLIITKKEMGYKVRLIFVLPCKCQDNFWSDQQRKLYRSLLAEADEIVYVSEEYSDNCMKKRNKYMVKQSAYCICALLRPLNKTNQTVRYAKQKGVSIINVAEQ